MLRASHNGGDQQDGFTRSRDTHAFECDHEQDGKVSVADQQMQEGRHRNHVDNPSLLLFFTSPDSRAFAFAHRLCLVDPTVVTVDEMKLRIADRMTFGEILIFPSSL